MYSSGVLFWSGKKGREGSEKGPGALSCDEVQGRVICGWPQEHFAKLVIGHILLKRADEFRVCLPVRGHLLGFIKIRQEGGLMCKLRLTKVERSVLPFRSRKNP